MVKSGTAPMILIQPAETLKIPEHYSNTASQNSKFRNSSNATHIIVHNVEGSEEKTIVNFIDHQTDRGL